MVCYPKYAVAYFYRGQSKNSLDYYTKAIVDFTGALHGELCTKVYRL
jgi:hypothetical protein